MTTPQILSNFQTVAQSTMQYIDAVPQFCSQHAGVLATPAMKVVTLVQNKLQVTKFWESTSGKKCNSAWNTFNSAATSALRSSQEFLSHHPKSSHLVANAAFSFFTCCAFESWVGLALVPAGAFVINLCAPSNVKKANRIETQKIAEAVVKAAKKHLPKNQTLSEEAYTVKMGIIEDRVQKVLLNPGSSSASGKDKISGATLATSRSVALWGTRYACSHVAAPLLLRGVNWLGGFLSTTLYVAGSAYPGYQAFSQGATDAPAKGNFLTKWLNTPTVRGGATWALAGTSLLIASYTPDWLGTPSYPNYIFPSLFRLAGTTALLFAYTLPLNEGSYLSNSAKDEIKTKVRGVLPQVNYTKKDFAKFTSALKNMKESDILRPKGVKMAPSQASPTIAGEIDAGSNSSTGQQAAAGSSEGQAASVGQTPIKSSATPKKQNTSVSSSSVVASTPTGSSGSPSKAASKAFSVINDADPLFAGQIGGFESLLAEIAQADEGKEKKALQAKLDGILQSATEFSKRKFEHKKEVVQSTPPSSPSSSSSASTAASPTSAEVGAGSPVQSAGKVHPNEENINLLEQLIKQSKGDKQKEYQAQLLVEQGILKQAYQTEAARLEQDQDAPLSVDFVTAEIDTLRMLTQTAEGGAKKGHELRLDLAVRKRKQEIIKQAKAYQ